MVENKKLPNGWCLVKFSEFSDLIRGVNYKKHEASIENKAGYLPVIRANNIGVELSFYDLVYVPERNISEEQKIREGDIIISMSSGSKHLVGKSALARASFNGSYGAFCGNLRTSNLLNQKYVYYYLSSPENRKALSKQSKGSNINNLKREHILDSYIPLAPLTIQGAIVQRIEELFSHIDAGVEGLKQTKAKLQQYRQSVLKDAVTGKLTEKWREQNADKIEPADRLLGRILAERREHWEQEQLKAFAAKGSLPKDDKWKEKYKEPPVADVSLLPELPAQWVWSTITQLGELNRGKSKHRPRNDPVLYGGDYPFIQTGDVRAADGVLKTYTQTYSEKGLAQSRLWPKGTLCITIAANIAETAILGIDACFPDSIVGFIPHDKLVSVEYIEFFFRTAKQNLDRYAPATAQKNINLEILESVAVPFMSVAEQQALVLVVSEKLDAANRAENLINSKIKHSAALKASILTKAFSGGLVPNESAQSALELLEKIKSEKQKLVNEAKSKPKKEKKVTTGRKSLESVLKTIKEPVSPEELMQLAEFSLEEVEEFYIELAMLSDRLEKVTPTKEQLKNWPYEKDASLKLKLKD
jgi:type I restriction enzyme S subunit